MKVTIYSNDNSIDWEAKGTERIVQNVRNILRTRRFEVPFIPLMGISSEFLEDVQPSSIMSELSSHITEVIKTYEPRAEVTDVKIVSCNENGDYVISVELEVQGNE